MVTLLLVAVNFFVIYESGLQESRWSRFISVVFLFIFFLRSRKIRSKLLVVVFTFLLLSGSLSLNNEVLIIRKINLAVIIMAYACLIYYVRPFVRNLKTDFFQKLIFLVVVSINFFMLFMLGDMVGGTVEDNVQLYLLVIRGVSLIILMVFAFSFTHRYSSAQSFFFLLAVLGLVFSDIFAFIAFYLEVNEFMYADRLLYFLGIGALVRYAMLAPQEVISKTEELV